MQAQLQEKIEGLVPPKLGTILDVYMRLKKKQVQTKEGTLPLITVYLSNNQSLHGRIMNCDFVTGRVSFLVTTPDGGMDVIFFDMGYITSITLHDLGLYGDFVQELVSRD